MIFLTFTLLFHFFIFPIKSINRPIIGILTQPTKLESKPLHSYIPATYIKWVESGGGKALPIFYDDDLKNVEKIFKSINGILFAGGSVNLSINSTFYQTSKYLYDLVIKENNKGEYFPLFGTCQGFQQLFVLTSGDLNVLEYEFDSADISIPLIFKNEVNSKIFKDFPNEKQMFEKYNISLNWHHNGISLEKFEKYQKLKDFYDVVSYNYDKNGRDFISTIEAKNFPVYGVQWHPEQVIFDDYPLHANHSYLSIKANGFTQMFFINEARKSNHKFNSTEEEDKYVIYNYSPHFVDITKEPPFQYDYKQIYFFEKVIKKNDLHSVALLILISLGVLICIACVATWVIVGLFCLQEKQSEKRQIQYNKMDDDY